MQGPIVPNQVEVYFSPKGGATEAIVREINRAKKSIHVQAYSFTSPTIAKALVEAKRRGLKVEILVDKSQRSEKYTEADFTAHAGISTFIDDGHAIAHNKLMILDEETVITGSFNFTRSAEERNAENVLILSKTPALARKYMDNWHAHRKHSEPYAGR
ncbi:MAG: phospholipase D family protein [Verrucomicrobiaceae bacterium]|nr:MAG: phospholipase D family protein [Verrucomicrobiaceae bacterium]